MLGFVFGVVEVVECVLLKMILGWGGVSGVLVEVGFLVCWVFVVLVVFLDLFILGLKGCEGLIFLGIGGGFLVGEGLEVWEWIWMKEGVVVERGWIEWWVDERKWDVVCLSILCDV